MQLVDTIVCVNDEYIVDGRLSHSKMNKMNGGSGSGNSSNSSDAFRFVCIRYLSAGSSQNEVCDDESEKCNISVEIKNTSSEFGLGFENNSTYICTRLVEFLTNCRASESESVPGDTCSITGCKPGIGTGTGVDLLILCERLPPEALTVLLSSGIHVVSMNSVNSVNSVRGEQCI